MSQTDLAGYAAGPTMRTMLGLDSAAAPLPVDRQTAKAMRDKWRSYLSFIGLNPPLR